MKELRDIKLDLLMGNKNPVIDLFNQITKDIKIINTSVYNEEGLEFIYFVPTKDNKDYEWVFYQDAENDKFWCNFATYWSFFENKLGLEYLEIQSITKFLVEEALKREVTTPPMFRLINSREVEEALKREVSTPEEIQTKPGSKVEETLKREVAKPHRSNLIYPVLVEDALKREVGTPYYFFQNIVHKVEEVLKREISNPKPEIHKMDSMVLNALKRDTEKE